MRCLTVLKHISPSTCLRWNSLKACVVGAGPAGFYTTGFLTQSKLNIDVDIIEKLPTPFGLVRYGVAPDHPEVKIVENRFSEIATLPNVRYFGNVSLGKDVSLNTLREYYDIIVLTYGAETSRKLGIPGEDLKGVESARDFISWYNTLPNHSAEYDKLFEVNEAPSKAVIIGNGNVALDVARILLKDVSELQSTDISPQTLNVLSNWNIKEVHIMGRRGPVQAAFTTKELRELTLLSGVQIRIAHDQLPITSNCEKKLQDRATKRKYDLLKRIKEVEKPGNKNLYFHFWKSPILCEADPKQKNKLKAVVFQDTFPNSTGILDTIETPLLFYSIGYKSLPIPELVQNFFLEDKGIISNIKGRVVDKKTGEGL